MECGAWQAGDREGRPYGGLQGVPCGRADRGVRPYGWGIDGAVCGGAHGPRPTRAFARIVGGQGRPPLRCCVTKKSVGEGLCPSRGRGNRRSAAGGGCSEPVSRKCPDWRTRQWPGIGWHDGGQENPAPTEAQQEVQWAGDRKGRPYESVTRGGRGERNPPVTASPCQPPLGKGPRGRGRIVTGALRPRNDSVFS